ncbi:MAG: hypothetical protein GKR89_02515 [Candidatus Latescibacteria bacterium]|nr:hypothetical protein [Candidatus Latescibacterota bacterium]
MPARSTTKRSFMAVRPRRWKVFLWIFALGLFVYLLLGGEQGLYRTSQKHRELAALTADIARLESQNDSLRQILWRLEHDLDYVEKVAREEYGMVKKGERVYRVRPQSAP